MLISCQYCGRVHQRGEVCPRKPLRKKYGTMPERVRNTYAWRKKRDEIKKRDLNCCRLCLIDETKSQSKRFNYKNLSVHHIVPIEEDFSKSLDDDNLITLCEDHHKLCELGKVSRDFLFELAKLPPLKDF